jgi:hypothetical protein
MSFWAHLWNRLKALPAGVWAALAVGLTLLGLYLRGRRLEAELAKSLFQTATAKAKSVGAKAQGKAEVHLQQAEAHATNAQAISKKLEAIQAAGETERKRLAALPASQVTDEYLKLLKQKKPGG